MEIKTFFFDTYAFHELISGNLGYKEFVKGVAIVTTRLNLMELYYGLLLKYDESFANKYYDELIKYTVDVEDAVIKAAMLLRARYKDRGLSYIACIGYMIAKKMNIKFLTGDNQFRDLDNVEFVK